MVVVKANVIDTQVNDVIRAVELSNLCNLIHRRDIKAYIRNKQNGRFYSMDEEELSFCIDSTNEEFEQHLDELIRVINNSTTDKFLEISISTEIEEPTVQKVLKGLLTQEEFKEICNDAVITRWK